MPTFDSDKAMTVCGVAGRLTHRTTKPGQAPGLWFNQRWISESRPIDGYGAGAVISAEIRFDDQCGNGQNSFAVTGDIYRMARTGERGGKKYGRKMEIAGGCLHEDIAKAFPELSHLIKWHRFDATGPMHYVANTLYALQNCAPKFVKIATAWGEGKERDLRAARSTAVWPDATDAELCADRETLKAALLARLPALVAAFRADIEAAGLLWSPEGATETAPDYR